MKKLFAVLALALVVVGCSSKEIRHENAVIIADLTGEEIMNLDGKRLAFVKAFENHHGWPAIVIQKGTGEIYMLDSDGKIKKINQ